MYYRYKHYWCSKNLNINQHKKYPLTEIVQHEPGKSYYNVIMILVFNLVYDFATNMEQLSPSIPDSIIDYTNITENTSTYDNINNVSSSVYKSYSYDPQIPPTLPISLNDLGTHVASCHSDGNAAFSEQYKVIIIIYDSISFVIKYI